ncbi:MAG: 3-methyl-2-oxobutanoate hydroxymethyltransferase, partial [archaeon]|nr:3-methyl-2-oxobutanoate hydroxymethyltransferase [archaeon]
MEKGKLRIEDIVMMKGKRKIAMITAYDYPTALLADK